jgi:hypothetical protein
MENNKKPCSQGFLFAENCKDYLHFLEPQFFALAFAVVFEDLVAFVEQSFEL